MKATKGKSIKEKEWNHYLQNEWMLAKMKEKNEKKQSIKKEK